MALRFRNLTVTPDDPVSEWGAEGILTALERGGAQHWGRIAAAVAADPGGETARAFEEAASMAESPGAVAAVRAAAAYLGAGPRERTVRRIRDACLATELTQAQIAARLGTSASRLSTYLSGAVIPSAEFLTRLETLAANRIAEVTTY
ncbi:MAG: helix-turn-helix domain-containing protein [Frankiaceae bacterium]|jgi:DNA-binding transcriptional regulator YiaG|nr:helix-turn-helix domain-containing protein [Frankiaceae bacterium]